MPTALALAPLTLAAVLVLSGLAKLPDPRATHAMMTLLRLPRAVTSATVARVLPWGELSVAALLLTPWRWSFGVGSLAAFLLLLAFWVIIARAMTFDPRPTCGCFGRVGEHPVTARTVVRNSVLLALAAVTAVLALQGRTAAGLLRDFGTGDWLWLLLAVTLGAVAVLVLSGGTPDPDDAVGSPTPRGLLVDRDHEVRDLGQLSRQRAQLLVLANCWCGSTVAAVERVPAWRERLPQLGVQVVHTQPSWDEPRLAALDGVWWDPGARVYAAVQAGASPAAVLLGTDGLVAGGPVSGVAAIEHLVEGVAAELAESQVLDPDPVRGSDAP